VVVFLGVVRDHPKGAACGLTYEAYEEEAVKAPAAPMPVDVAGVDRVAS
jgi:molybdopterin synthase catalytic subunit